MKGRWILDLALAAALVAPEPGFAASTEPDAASRPDALRPHCVPLELQVPGSAAFEPFMVFFDLGSAKIGRNSAAILKNAANIYRQFPKCVLELTAHIDGMEAASHVPDLSAERADAVIRFLRRHGVVMRTRVTLSGDTEWMVNTPEGAADAENRLVILVMAPETLDSKP